MKRKKLVILASIIAIGISGFTASAQAPLPPPGNPGGIPPMNTPGNPGGLPPQGPGPVIVNPAPIPNPNTVVPPPGPNPNTPPPPPGWGASGYLVNPPVGDWMNSGTLNVMATGYDSEGVMIQIPLYISYQYNGVNYNITVLNSWNPYTQIVESRS